MYDNSHHKYNYQMHPHSIENRLLRAYGKTAFLELAVWMLPDGTLVNGSYEGYQRDIDHHEIGEFYTQSDKWHDSIIYVQKFMRRGNIRTGCSKAGYTFQMLTTPSVEQLYVMLAAGTKAKCTGLDTAYSRYSPVASRYIWEDFDEWTEHYVKRYIPDKLKQIQAQFTLQTAVELLITDGTMYVS